MPVLHFFLPRELPRLPLAFEREVPLLARARDGVEDLELPRLMLGFEREVPLLARARDGVEDLELPRLTLGFEREVPLWDRAREGVELREPLRLAPAFGRGAGFEERARDPGELPRARSRVALAPERFVPALGRRARSPASFFRTVPRSRPAFARPRSPEVEPAAGLRSRVVRGLAMRR